MVACRAVDIFTCKKNSRSKSSDGFEAFLTGGIGANTKEKKRKAHHWHNDPIDASGSICIVIAFLDTPRPIAIQVSNNLY